MLLSVMSCLPAWSLSFPKATVLLFKVQNIYIALYYYKSTIHAIVMTLALTFPIKRNGRKPVALCFSKVIQVYLGKQNAWEYPFFSHFRIVNYGSCSAGKNCQRIMFFYFHGHVTKCLQLAPTKSSYWPYRPLELCPFLFFICICLR